MIRFEVLSSYVLDEKDGKDRHNTPVLFLQILNFDNWKSVLNMQMSKFYIFKYVNTKYMHDNLICKLTNWLQLICLHHLYSRPILIDLNPYNDLNLYIDH